MKLSRIAALGGGLTALFLGATMLAPGALAQQPPTPVTGNTTGTAGGGAGNATVYNIADLKYPISASDYDDDPAPNPGSPWFHITPNLDDNPMQMAHKYVFINNPAGVIEVQKTIEAVHTVSEGRPATTTVVFHDQRPGRDIKTGQACADLLGSFTTPGTVAHGLITTGQKTAAELQATRNACLEGHAGILENPFPVSKHLPPGWYQQCATLAQAGGATSPTYCVWMNIQAITGFATDVDTIPYGNLVQFVKSIWPGDFVMDDAAGEPPTGQPDHGTIQGIGNTSPKVLVAWTFMVNGVGTTDPGDDKYIERFFDIQLNRRDTAGNIIATQRLDNMVGGGPTTFGVDYDTTTGPATPAEPTPLAPICLEPNENIKVDFSVTPQDVLYAGTYTGRVRLTVTNTGSPCTPTLGPGESASGDANVYDNLPGTLVYQGPIAP